MPIAFLTLELSIEAAQSLKDKRQVVRSIKDRLANKFNVAVAEVDSLEDRQIAVLGFATVGNEVKHVRSVLEEVLRALRCHPIAELIDHEIEL